MNKVYYGPEDVYKELVEESDEDWLYGLVAFAYVEEKKIEWMRHHEQRHGSPPSHQEIQGWYQQQPQSVLISAKGSAESALQEYSQTVIGDTINQEIEQHKESVTVREVRNSRKFWPLFGISVAGGFVASLLLAAIILLVAWVVIDDPSPVKIAKAIHQHQEKVEESENAEEQ